MPKNNKEKKIKIRVTDIVAKPQKVAIKKGKGNQKSGPKSEPEKLIQIEIPKGAAVEEPAIIDIASDSRENILKDMAGIGKKAREFEEAERERFKKEEKLKKKGKGLGWRGYAAIFLLLAILGAGVYAALVYLPKVKIQIAVGKTEWKFNDTVLASKKASSINIQNKTIPAEIFSEKKSFTYSFPATGRKPTATKATGKITIWNNFSAVKQPLVATTRFETPDGKIFRLINDVVVPAAKIVNSKIVATSIDADVRADQTGENYNIGTVAKFTIPGFKEKGDLPRYSGFYGSSNDPMTGGTSGQSLYPTDQDIKNAENQAKSSLKQSIDSLLRLDISPEFVAMDDSEDFKVVKEFINKDVDQSGNASIILDGQGSIAAFRKADVLDLMRSLANGDLGPEAAVGYGDFEAVNYSVSYSNAKLNIDQGQISFTANFDGNFWQPINNQDFIQKALGKNETDLKALIYSLPSVEKATISFWPFWVQSVPQNVSRVSVTVQ